MDTVFTEALAEQLYAPLDPRRVTAMEKGPAAGVPYLQGHDVTRAANELFGFGSWGFELQTAPWAERGEDKDGKPYTVWLALGRVTVRGGQAFSDVGSNQQSGPGASAVEMSIKGAVTDAMKRCLRQYGDQFGLVLYDKTMTPNDLRADYHAYQEAKRKGVNAATGEIAAPPMQPDPPAEMTTPPAPAALIAAPTPAAQRQPPFGFHFKDGELVPDEEPGDEELPLREQLRRANVTLGDVAKAIDFAVAGRTQAEIEMALRVYLKQNPDVTLRQVLGEAAHRKGRQPVGARSN